MNKRYLYDSKKFMYELIEDELYLDEEKDILYFVEQEIYEFINKRDLIEFQGNENNSETYRILYTINPEVLENVLRGIIYT
jgi:glycerol-3-phosphate O-acyltransferase